MGIYAAPPKRRPTPRIPNILDTFPVALAVGSVVTFGLVGAGRLDIAWLAIAGGEALLALALLIGRG